ncbi:MAG: benzoyl-CoA reductase subunit C [Calditrichaeota bacterium]|nr:MAG: benzoyl-CoA reductase subunit C [Calditrichota bacterium]
MKSLEEILEYTSQLAFDLEFRHARDWKAEDPTRVLIGYLPIYFPREIVHAMNGLAVGIMGAGDRIQIIKGDAYYQSYICHMPRGIIELALNGNLDNFDGFIFPSICDVIRNLSGMFQILGKGKFVKYLDYPQNFLSHVGGEFYRAELMHVIQEIEKLNGVKLSPEKLNQSIRLYNRNRKLIEEIYTIRQDYPWRLSAVDLYHLLRAGLTLPVEMHNELLETVLIHIQEDIGEEMDKIKVVVSGAFCEQPPVGLIKTIEIAGCYIVDDDFMLGSRWIEGDVDDTSDDPVGALVDAYLSQSTFSSAVYDIENPKSQRLLELVRRRKADGIIFAAPSFCDPALLDRPTLQNACEEAGIRYISFQYHENTGQFKVIQEQVGAFSDSIKLWEDMPLEAS